MSKNYNKYKQTILTLDPDVIYFTHSKIRKRFTGCNKLIEDTLNEIQSKITTIDDIPIITVYCDGHNYFTQNNRRLYLYKKCKSKGLLKDNLINVLIKPMGKKRYTINNCSLNASAILN